MPRKKKDMSNSGDEDESNGEDIAHSDTKSTSLYQVLGVDKTASHQEIRKAYHKLALQLHPDKNQGDENAKEKFQSLQKVISILGDPEKKKLYDQTGCVDDVELEGEAVRDLCEFFRTLYRKITEEDIIEFEASYRGSEEEKRDLQDLYMKCKGNMDRVFDRMICCEAKLDSHRFKDIIDAGISTGELKEWKAYRQWAAKVSKRPSPPNPLKRPAKRKDPTTDVMAIIAERQNDRKQRFDSMFSSLAAKFGSTTEIEEPTEEEFEAARKRMEAGKQKKSGSNTKRKRKC